MDPEKEDVFSDPDEKSDRDLDRISDQDLDSDRASDQDSAGASEEEDEGGRIFNAWMQRCRGESHKSSATEEETEQEVTERTGSRAGSRTGSRNNLELPPRMGRRASLPCPSTLSSLSRLHVSTAAPVTAKLLLRRTSSRRLLPPPQEVPPPPGERRSSLIPHDVLPHPGERRSSLIPHDFPPYPGERRASLAPQEVPPPIPERERDSGPEPGPEPGPGPGLDRGSDRLTILERRGHFRRRNVMSLSDADSVCLICHNELRHGTGGTTELQCSHTFHKECIEEYLWRKQQCPTCHVQVSLPQTLIWTSTLKVP